MIKSIVCLFVLMVSSLAGMGQEPVVVTTAGPFLGVSPDARGGGMGETGVARTPDVYSMYYNAARYAFVKGRWGVGASYLPWMKEVISGQHLFALNGYYRLNGKQALAVGVRYMRGKEFTGTDEAGETNGDFSPSDYAIDIAYSRVLCRNFSAALTMRYVNISLGKLKLPDMDGCDASGAVAFDLGMYYRSSFFTTWKYITWSVGLNLSNVGTKIASLSTEKDAYLPATMRLGGAMEVELNRGHRVNVALDISKMLVRAYDPDKAGESVFSNIAGSFGNPGFLKSLIWQWGAEYSWREMLAFRVGYFHESKTYGARQYLTLGGGVVYRRASLDFSYLLPTGTGDAPYKDTFRVSLGYVFQIRRTN